MNQFKMLLKNIKEYLTYAEEAYNKKNFNTSITLFFKALTSICDYHIFLKTGVLPSNHENRFRILQTKFPFLYRIIDKDFPFYRESYRITIDKRNVDLIKDDVYELIKKLKLESKLE